MSRPDQYRYGLGYGIVERVYPDSWEVDILAADGGRVSRAVVLGPRLPEISAQFKGGRTDRPQWVLYGFASHLHGAPVCWPIESRETNDRANWVYYAEVLDFRITINRQNELEIRNTHGETLLQFRIQETDGVMRLDTPHTRVVLKDADQSIDIHCDKPLTISCETATVNVDKTAVVNAGESVAVNTPLWTVNGS